MLIFLWNIANKKKVDLLRDYLNERGINTNIAPADADLLIIKTATDLKRNKSDSVRIVGDDIDLLIMYINLSYIQ